MDATLQQTGGVRSQTHPAPSRGPAVDQDALPHRALRPFLKWAGGKRQLLPALGRFYPARFGTYHEPFLGSGAVFFDLASHDAVRPGRVRLTDVNRDLIGCWRQLRDDRDAVIAHLQRLAAERLAAPAEHYYYVRDECFNPARVKTSSGGQPRAERYTPELAAMLIYLNRTGFNGLFRVNSKGLFNVPRGRYRNPKICDEHNLRQTSEVLSTLGAVINYAPYDAVLDVAYPGDFVYLDPPYAPLSATALFTSYTAERFDASDQRRLQQVVIALASRGCHVLLSNSTAPEIATLYEGNRDAKRAGFRTMRVPARRAINSAVARRGIIDEYLITNVPHRPV